MQVSRHKGHLFKEYSKKISCHLCRGQHARAPAGKGEGRGDCEDFKKFLGNKSENFR